MMYWGVLRVVVVKKFRKRRAKRQLHALASTDSPTGLPRIQRAQTQHAMRMGRDWPVNPVIRPEQCQALGKNLPLADLARRIPEDNLVGRLKRLGPKRKLFFCGSETGVALRTPSV